MNPLDRLFSRIPDRPLIGAVLALMACAVLFGLGGVVGAIRDAEAAAPSPRGDATVSPARCYVDYSQLQPGERRVVECHTPWSKRLPPIPHQGVTIESGHPAVDASLVQFYGGHALFALTNHSTAAVGSTATVTAH